MSRLPEWVALPYDRALLSVREKAAVFALYLLLVGMGIGLAPRIENSLLRGAAIFALIIAGNYLSDLYFWRKYRGMKATGPKLAQEEYQAIKNFENEPSLENRELIEQLLDEERKT